MCTDTSQIFLEWTNIKPGWFVSLLILLTQLGCVPALHLAEQAELAKPSSTLVPLEGAKSPLIIMPFR